MSIQSNRATRPIRIPEGSLQSCLVVQLLLCLCLIFAPCLLLAEQLHRVNVQQIVVVQTGTSTFFEPTTGVESHSIRIAGSSIAAKKQKENPVSIEADSIPSENANTDKEIRGYRASEFMDVTLSTFFTPATTIEHKKIETAAATASKNTADQKVASQSTSAQSAIHDVNREGQSFSLKELIETALKNNKQIEIARQKALQSKGELTQARSGYLPHLELEGSYNYVRRKDGSTLAEDGAAIQSATNSNEIVSDDVARGTVRLSQLIYDFGKTGSAITMGRKSLNAAEANLSRQISGTIFQVKKAYYSILEKSRLIEVAEESVQSFRQHLEQTRTFHHAGVRTRVDVINAEVELSNAQLNRSKALYNLKIAQTAFNQVVGWTPPVDGWNLQEAEVRLESMLAIMPDIDEHIENQIAQAEKSRPDVIQIQNLIESAKANVSSVKGEYLPSIKASATYNDYNTNLSVYQDNLEAGLTCTWDIFSGLHTYGSLTSARAKLKEYEAQLADLVMTVRQEITESWLRTSETRESVQIAVKTLELAKENLVLAEKRYQTGSSDILEYNEAQRNLLKAKNDLIVNYYDFLTALAGYEFATGR